MTESTLTPALGARMQRQLDAWRGELLALDRRQRLLYFKHTRTASLEITQPDLDGVLRAVASGRSHVVAGVADGEIKLPWPQPHDLVAGNKNPKDLVASLRRLDQSSQQVYADRGFWTLYVGVGMLSWLDPDDGRAVDSPLILLPVRLRRGGSLEPYVVERTEDEALVNPSLRLKLGHDFGLRLPEFDPYADDLREALTDLASAVWDRPGWNVEPRVVITTFSFHKEAIYRDLSDNAERVMNHPLVQLVGLGPDAPSARDVGFEPYDADELDEVVPPERLMSILDADSSQRQCILAARDGHSFVMDGPPGTGKSQTIANVIAELMAAGKTVLFVSEKAAALDVVRKRLADARLDHFLLELHSHAATRKQIAVELDKALNQRPQAQSALSGADAASLADARVALSSYAHAVNDVRPRFERSLHWALGELARTEELRRFTVTPDKRWAQLSAGELARIIDAAEALGRAWGPVADPDGFLWRELSRDDLSSTDVQRARERVNAARLAGVKLRTRLAAVDEDLGLPLTMSLADAHRRLDVLEHLAGAAAVPEHWFTAPDLGVVRDRLAQVHRLAEGYAAASHELHQVAGDRWGELDPDRGEDLVDLASAPGDFALLATSTTSQAVAARDFLARSPAHLAAIEEDARLLAGLFGMESVPLTCDLAGRLGALAKLGATPTPPEPSWLRPGVQAALEQSARVLQELVVVVRQRDESMSQMFTKEALDLDLAALNTRFRETHRGLRRFSAAARADRKALKAVTVTGKVDKDVLARLDEAVAWQRAERALTRGERDHAAALGGYYRRTQTDFARIATALGAAQEAIALAGSHLDPQAAAQQLSTAGQQDPRLTVVGSRLVDRLEQWRAEGSAVLPAGLAVLDEHPVTEAAALCAAVARRADRGIAALEHVSAVCGADVTIEVAPRVLANARAAAQTFAEVLDTYDQDQVLLGDTYRGTNTDFSDLRGRLDWTDRLRELLRGPVSPHVAEALSQPTFVPDDLRPVIDAWTAARDKGLKLFLPGRRAELSRELDADLELAELMLDELHEQAAGQIEEWCAFVANRRRLLEAGLEEVLDRLEKEVQTADSVAPAIRRAVLLAWVDATIATDPALQTHRAVDRDGLTHQFRQLDRRQVDATYASVVAACTDLRPRSKASRAAQLVAKEGQKKSRHWPIRRLLEEAGDLAHKLKPCFMMSPLSVSQYLPASMSFDVVIFDEASQVLPSDAINCIYRGRQLVVAGDQKQLPPTSFFTRAVDDDEDVDDDDELGVFQSVLDLCKAAGAFPSLPLTWHYRSQHEDLITYSNFRFYDRALHTFPGASYRAADIGIEVFVVDGIYRRGGARDNPIEAERVVDRILEHRTSHPELSLGVVTFSVAQEDAVLAAVERRAIEEPVLRGILEEHDRLDGFFVKNLENVQGDERDVIVFSIGYGPDEHGRFTMNFGPLNPAGGWRRLNVAITRARRRVEVVCSFRPEQMSSTGSEGVKHLKGYLDFVHRGTPALGVDLEDELGADGSAFEDEVARVIRSWGYEVATQVGSAGYRIDVAVRHPDLPGRYLLAVECDGTTYHSSKVARDRDRLRREVLEGLGWSVHRVWGISWVRDRVGQEKRLRTAIEDAAAGRSLAVPSRERHTSPVAIEEADFDAAPSWAHPYERALPGWHSYSSPGSIDALPVLRSYVERVVDAEGPVHIDLIMKNLREDSGVGRVGSVIRENLDRALGTARIASQPVVGDAAGFYRVQHRTLQAVRVPVDDDTIRKPLQMPPEELDLAVVGVVRDGASVDVEQVVVDVSRLFGWRRVGNDIRALVEDAISRCEQRRVLSRTSGNSLVVR
jgi:very-short-patch-repair endonuclease